VEQTEMQDSALAQIVSITLTANRQSSAKLRNQKHRLCRQHEKARPNDMVPATDTLKEKR
jgi:hypothetical protein